MEFQITPTFRDAINKIKNEGRVHLLKYNKEDYLKIRSL